MTSICFKQIVKDYNDDQMVVTFNAAKRKSTDAAKGKSSDAAKGKGYDAAKVTNYAADKVKSTILITVN